jgi:BlaI family transcriptional regulator, penicillinase repressor
MSSERTTSETDESGLRGPYASLSRRERQIMEILYRQSPTTAASVHGALADPPSYSAVRALLRILELKGHVRHERRGPRYVYVPIIPQDKAKQSALQHLMTTFFEGSVAQVVSALLDLPRSYLSAAELDRLAGLIEDAKQGDQGE